MTKTIFDKLAVKQKFQERVLKDYVDILNRVFQIIYELDVEVDWLGIERCSPVSNFGIVRGTVVVPEGEKIKNSEGNYASFDEKKVFDAGFMLPLRTLDECTPYEISEYVHQLKMLRVITTPEEFIDFLNTPDIDADDIQEYLPSGIPRPPKDEDEDSTSIIDEEFGKSQLALPDGISGFDLTGLSETQVLSLVMNMIGDDHGTKQ